MVITVTGQLFEAIGAFGYPDNGPTNWLQNVHDAGVVIGPLGIVLLIFALIATGALLIGTRLGFRESRWFGITLVVAAVAAAMFVIGAFIFGY